MIEAKGQRAAQWVKRDRPHNELASQRLHPLRLPATADLPLPKPIAANQLCSIASLAPAVLRLLALGQLRRAELAKDRFCMEPHGLDNSGLKI